MKVFRICSFIVAMSCHFWILSSAESCADFNVTLIFTESGGGHKAAMAAYEDAIRNFPGKPEGMRVNIRKVDPFADSILGKMGTRFWDTCFRESYYDLIPPVFFVKDLAENHVLPAVAPLTRLPQSIPGMGQKPGVLKSLDSWGCDVESILMRDGKPDMIISLIGPGNKQFLAFARDHGIPFRIGVADYKADNFIEGIRAEGIAYSREQFEVYVPSDSGLVTQELRARRIPYAVTGYPVSASMGKMARDLRERNPETLAEISRLLGSFQVQPDDSILFVMMGAKGFDMNATIKYLATIRKNAAVLHKDGKKLHLFLAAGQNESLRNVGKELAAQNNADFEIHALGNLTVEEVALYMGIYQLGNPYLMFTKPGGSTVGQVDAMGTPTLYSLNPMEHERFNAQIMTSYRYADMIDMAYRSQTLHVQKALEVGARAVEQQIGNSTAWVAQVTALVGPVLPFAGLFNQVSTQVGQMVGATIEQVQQVAEERVPAFILNQDVVDEVALVNILKKYLVENIRFNEPPMNRFAEIVGPMIYDDLMRLSKSRD